MLKKRFPLIIALGLLVLASSCSKNNDNTTVQQLSYTGDISGHVSLYDQYGSKVLTGLSSVTVTAVGGPSVSPDATGYYVFYNASTGVYDFTASDSGYAYTQTNNFQYLGDTLNKDIKMSAIPDFSPTGYTADTALGALSADSVVLTFNADTRARNCILFVNNATTVGNVPANYLLVYTKAIAANQTKVTISIPSGDLTDAGIAPGSTIYCAAYGYVVGDVSVYEDQTTGKNVYNAVSSTPLLFTATAP